MDRTHGAAKIRRRLSHDCDARQTIIVSFGFIIMILQSRIGDDRRGLREGMNLLLASQEIEYELVASLSLRYLRGHHFDSWDKIVM
jgi:hypothetical protein